MTIKKISSATLACLLFAFVSFFSVCSFTRTVKAESVVEYSSYFGSNLWSPILLFTPYSEQSPASSADLGIGYYHNGNRSVELGYVLFTVNLRENEDGTSTFAPEVYYAEDLPYSGGQVVPPNNVMRLLPMVKKWGANNILASSASTWFESQIDKNGVRVYIFFETLISSNSWTPNVVSVQFFRHQEQIGTSRIYYYNCLRFFDINGEYADIRLCCNLSEPTDVPSYNGWDERTYYLRNPNNFSDNENYQIGYDDGYGQGLLDGEEGAYGLGYTNGFNLGNEQGYNQGLNDGRSENITFLSLLTAVVDAPIQAIYKAFDFEVLGMNMRDFFLGLVSIAIIIFIIRFVTGKKDG